jgi:peptide methionine sulfoxide reductase msrA/msrB
MTQPKANHELATFAGGCFWCMESAFKPLDGVLDVVSGYSGGDIKNPTYEQVSSGKTKHIESIQIKYNSKKITYQQLLDHFWKNINPTDPEGQFADRGPQYQTAIFYHNENQKKLAEQSKTNAQKDFKDPIVTKILKYKNFYKAKDYHQDYATKNPLQYKLYETGSGRKSYLNSTK